MRTIYPIRKSEQPARSTSEPPQKIGVAPWYSLPSVTKNMAKRPGQILAGFAFAMVLGLLIYTFASGAETTIFSGVDFTNAPKSGLGVGSDGLVRLQTLSTIANFNRIVYNYSSIFTVSQEAQKYVYMNMQSTDSSTAKQLKASNPNLKITVYLDGRVTRSGDPDGLTTCVSYSVAQSHPDWFLRDQNGNLISNPGYNGTIYHMDIGNSGYRQECAQHSQNMVKAGGFDGVYYDEMDARYEWTFGSGIYSPLYPTDTAFQNVETGELSYLYSIMHSNRLLMAANLGGTTYTPGLWQTWSQYLDIAMEESWTDGGEGTAQQIPDWSAKLAQALWSEQNHKQEVLHSYNTTEAGNTYGLASLLLIGGGYSSYSVSPSYNQSGMTASSEVLFPEYGTATQLGAPTASYSKLSNGVYKRTFQNGIVLVNPTATSIGSFSLGGSYSGSGLTNITTVSMTPTDGLILLKN